MKKFLALGVALIIVSTVSAQSPKSSVAFRITLDQPGQSFHVRMDATGIDLDSVTVKMPAWTPGYYQLLNFADNVSNFKVSTAIDNSLAFARKGRNGWRFKKTGKNFTAEYDVKAKRAFVAVPFLDNDHGYIAPTGVFLYIAGLINLQATVQIDLPQEWIAATGLDRTSENKFIAPDFDILFDSPILLGKLEELPTFEVKGVLHRFIGYELGDFDKVGFINDLKKIVEVSTTLIGDVPYKHYTFLAIGPGPGGIEHLNSTTFGFSGDALKSDAGKKRMYTFLAHEYFHHYNVKRIRPIELGPFDYDRENRTNMLWVSEGINVYYDILVTRRAGLMSDEDLFKMYNGRLLGFENKPGRLYQSATQASYNTWSDGPFGRSEDEVNKTVSVYDKGAILGLLLDFNIRYMTQNEKSLDDVMRALYREYYQQKKRGFTEAEFQSTCEKVAGTKLPEIFEYVATVKPIDYKKYFSYGGLDIDTQPKQVPGAWLGLSTRMRNDSLVVTNVEYESPAWKAGVRRRMIVTNMNGQKPASTIDAMLASKKKGEKISLDIFHQGQVKNFTFELGEKIEPDFAISPLLKPTDLQQKILKSWVTESK